MVTCGPSSIYVYTNIHVREQFFMKKINIRYKYLRVFFTNVNFGEIKKREKIKD